MIAIKDHFYISFSIPGMEDFIFPDEIVHFVYTETCGQSPPTFQLTFTCANKKVLTYVIPGETLEVRGSGKANKVSTSDAEFIRYFQFSTARATSVGTDKYQVEATGFLLTSEVQHYFTEPYRHITDEITAIDAIIESCDKSGLKHDINFNSQGKQYWIQPNISCKQFVDHLLEYAYTPDTFVISAICGDDAPRGKLKLRTLESLEDSGVLLTPEDEMYSFDPDWNIVSSSMHLNGFHGWKRIRPWYNLEEDKVEVVDQVQMTKFCNRKEVLPFTGDNPQPRKAALPAAQSIDNHDFDYNNAKIRNLTGNALYSTVNLTVTLSDDILHPELKILDRIKFRDFELGTGNKPPYDECISGEYFITGISYNLSKSNFITILKLGRELPNVI